MLDSQEASPPASKCKRSPGMVQVSAASAAPLTMLLVATLAVSSGCSSSGGSAVHSPSVDPTAAADKAIELYDKDGDGALSVEELQACPGILSVMTQYDANDDQKVDREELLTHLKSLYASGAGLMSVTATVLKGNRPVAGADIRMYPEEFLGDALQPAGGRTQADGVAKIAIPDDKLPADQQGLGVMQPGVYRVEIETADGKPATSKQPLGFEADPMSRTGAEATFTIGTR